MMKADVPCVPGYEGRDQSTKTMVTQAAEIGYPVMIKAAAGGGGRGMRQVHAEVDFEPALEIAKAEALSAFNSDKMILEKAIVRARHVEFQIFADRKGNIIHLGERDCSVQRRHQKVVEESPCLVLTRGQRNLMGAAAITAARAIGYEGAGTVEFLLDAEGNFYFLEMNTRLQVEHPVTEMVTGLDLVSMQLATAMGRPLGIVQGDIEFFGHALEVRLCAEDPAQDFLPSTGKIVRLDIFDTPYARVDCGVFEGQEISVHYDPMIAKIITHGETREEAVFNMINALENMHIFGPVTNRDFLLQILQHEKFLAGEVTTAFIEENFGTDNISPSEISITDIVLAAGLLVEAELQKSLDQTVVMTDELLGWSSSGQLSTHLRLDTGEKMIPVRVLYEAEKKCSVVVDGNPHSLKVTTVNPVVDGNQIGLHAHDIDGDQIFLGYADRTVALTRKRATAKDKSASGGSVVAPMHGNLLEVYVSVGDRVDVGSRLVVLEAMKMQHELRSTIVGTIKSVRASTGQQVKAGESLIEIDEEAS